MNRPDFIAALLEPDAYGHPCAAVQLVETHISWVFLTGDFAYKVKKPVRFNFVDFSTPELRAHYCAEEVRCNRLFSAELYLGVVTINRDDRGRYRMDGTGAVVEHAVKMRQFPVSQQLDRLLAEGGLGVEAMYRFGIDLAEQHGRLPRMEAADAIREVDNRVMKPVLDNFRTLEPLRAVSAHRELLKRLEADSQAAYDARRPEFLRRLQEGFTRECHGDLHLSNLVLLDGRIRAFDCLEFNANLRWIDTASDVAFLLMDCAVRGRSDLGHGFLDGYLTGSADYPGAVLSGFFQVYRSMVRAKVAALQMQEPGAPVDLEKRFVTHLNWADDRLHRGAGLLLLMCGFSGSGKSYLAQRLVPEFPAVRVRSDVLRKAQAGLGPQARSDSPVDGGLYGADQTRDVYAEMLRISGELVRAGDNVIVDATFLDRRSRMEFQETARRLGVGCVVVHCRASVATLEARVRDRKSGGDDPSEAGIEVLHRQLGRFDTMTADEVVVAVDTEAPLDIARLAGQILAAV